METTPIASYLSLRYALAADASALQGLNLKDGIWAHWLNEEGQPREPGDFQIVLRGLPTGETALMQSFGALQEAPGSITLSFYNGLTKEVFDQVTLNLSPKEEQ